MPTPELSRESLRPQELADQVVATVRRWLAASSEIPADRSAERLAGVLRDPVGLEFTLGFVDRVVRPEDLRVAGRNLERLSHRIPKFLPWYLRLLIMIGGGFAPVLPWPIIPIARRVLRGMVSHLVIDATPAKLDKSLVDLRGSGRRLNLNLLGEAVLGDGEADRRLAGTRELLQRDDVDYVSIKVSSVVSQLNMWAFDETVERVVERLAPLYEYAASAPGTKFINLDMEEYRDLDLTIEVFTRLLSRPSLHGLEAGIVIQAYLPDALGAYQRLTAWALERRRAGGAGIKVRVVKGANLAMERVDATVHGWPLATYGDKQHTDTNYKRVLEWAMTPERTDAVRIGVAGHNLFDLAFAWTLAQQRGVTTRVDIEMLLGMATQQAEVVRREVGGLLLYTPLVHPRDFDAAIAYLVRRLEENASDENFMSALFEMDDDAYFSREEQRFRASLADLDETVPGPNRTQDRTHPVVPQAPELFDNEPDTDPALPGNRRWARVVLERSAASDLGVATITAARVVDPALLDDLIEGAADAGARWGATDAAERARVLGAAGEVLSAFRGRLLEVMASETGKTIAEGDPEVSEAIDFAHYYAERARELDTLDHARFVPARLTVVTPPWNFPVAIPLGSVASALAAGSAVIIKPAPQARRCAAVMVEALWEAGVPREVLRLVDVEEGDLGQRLIAHPAVDRVILTGSFETAALFRSWRPDLPLLAETSGKNAIIVTPSADLDLAVNDIVKSAFGHAGQKCSAASLAILVGSVGKSERFRRQLVDAVSTLRVGWPQNPTSQMGPLIEPADGKLLRGLTRLGSGERWLVQPKKADGSGRLWTPGVRTGVAAGSEFHLTEYFGPVLGIMTAATLEEAIELQNAVPYGLTAGLHSLDADEVALWAHTVEAGNLYINRGITGAIVRRQPFGGWKRSSVGPGAKAGGPNYLRTLGSWRAEWPAMHENVSLERMDERARRVIEVAQPGISFAEFDRARTGARSDLIAWNEEFGVSRDVSALGVERNVFRYRPARVVVRLAEGAAVGDLVRVLAAAAISRATVWVSSAAPLPADLVRLPEVEAGVLRMRETVVESDAEFAERAASGLPADRIRLIGGSGGALAHALGGAAGLAVYDGEVTGAGRIELLPFLREQAVSLTAHRFGNPDRAMEELPL
ncbi:RHH-type proline utilization regulon transcriptional repressor/proline dehydrogenase/delta 1-pyrroline-5-carboxylate dehydrogenase [Diaminobutyricimonas aerilata]|uniref:L-glutamate gamma-semialdehyde dehydrogenase n=1 Tax=Diaminobutyricimonas aerilata TaxID=1162967 RepID=A0A2M9CFB7_9MICO|nr:bifunctional proline dehydrogenase/L-glutamate gamma-semialdehyde dehydrogenase [Diaminobutyricimonas aerilata]PJJ70593.1 RHH-type proline utilization regulon transcriptional repressor/proline dehydrogenase/delta 1-pyrroline-5-carboxylate dehydrogenase [Diaminobutyricimonas aerilata]